MDPRIANLTPEATLRTSQIIIVALAMGTVVFCGVAVAMKSDQPPDFPLLTYMSIGFAAMAAVLRLVVPPTIVNSARRQLLGKSPEEQSSMLLGLFQTKLIIGAAILEGAAFFALVAHLLEGNPLSLVVYVLLLVGILLSFPSRNGLENWLAWQIRQMGEEQSLRPNG